MLKNSSVVTALRVISGNLKGRKLASPRTSTTHPMGAREKNALFNMINVRGGRVLDAYAGSGALGIEALSRGAREVVFVENDRRAVLTIKQNLTSLSLGNTSVFSGKVADFVAKQAGFDLFDVIIADPPYDKFNLQEIAALSSLLVTGGTLVLSSSASQPTPELTELTTASSHTYAGARITILVKG